MILCWPLVGTSGRGTERKDTMKTLSRDSALLWLAIIGSLAVYLGASGPPTLWTWAQWMQFVAACVATISGKLGTSPLPGKTEADKIDMTAARLDAKADNK